MHELKHILKKKKCSSGGWTQGEGGGTKSADDEIRGPEYYANQIKAIEATDVSMFQSAVLFQLTVCLCTEMSVHVFFITQDYVLVFYWDAENAEASGADDKAAGYVLVFWQNKDAEKERKKNHSLPCFQQQKYSFP